MMTAFGALKPRRKFVSIEKETSGMKKRWERDSQVMPQGSMKISRSPFAGAIALLMAAILSPLLRADDARKDVNLESLLNEMVDRDALAKWPAPGYTLKEASSHDRRKTDPSDSETWHTNDDHEQFIRTETNEGRKEWVIMEDSGPGAITRFWTPLLKDDKAQIIRFYFDGATTPSLSVNFPGLLDGKEFARPPFAFNSWNEKDMRRLVARASDSPKPVTEWGSGADLYLPIPFAKSCKITLSSIPFYYVINYRMYDPGTVVDTFSLAQLQAAKTTVGRVGNTLLDDAPPDTAAAVPPVETALAPDQTMTLDLPKGSAAVRELEVRIDPNDAPQVMRSAILQATFDGEKSVWCPVGEFFGAGVRLNPIRDWDRTVNADGALTARWMMPYQHTGSISLQNIGSSPIKVKLSATTSPWQWDERSMIFHANWHSEHDIRTRPRSDWNYIDIHGKGVYVGDTLSVFNTAKDWYGEGDERIYLEGERVPSMIGTGTEDYYGFAWGMPDYFNSPFLSAPVRDDGRYDWRGYTTDSRLRLLDDIPFRTELRHDMEIWNWADTQVDYAVGLFWYALPGGTSNREPQLDEARLPVKDAPGHPSEKIAGAIECETLPATLSPDTDSEVQTTGVTQVPFSGGQQLLVKAAKVGDFAELEIAVADDKPRKVTFYGTRSYDYGIVRFTINGEPAGKDFDGYQNAAHPSGPVKLGTFNPKNGKMILRAEVVGTNPASRGNRYDFGLDCVVLGPP
jgi:hypothetical protein